MTRWKRLFYYLLINVLVSACTTLAVLAFWERTHPLEVGGVLPFFRTPSSPIAPTIPNSMTPESTPTQAQANAPPTVAETNPPLINSTALPENSSGVVIAYLFGAGDLATERVRLEQRGDREVTLTKWRLQDENGNSYVFPQLTLYPGGTIDIFTGVGVNDVGTLYWGLDEPVWESGEIATLVDDQGNIQARYTAP